MSELRPDDPEALLAQSNWLRRLARGLVRDENAAEDLAQDTWVAALRRKPAAGAADLRAWMNVVARNFARRSKRDAGLRAAHEPRAAREERIEGPDEIAARVELQRKLAEALLALEEPFRSALVLRYLDGLSTIQVAEKLGVSHDAARQRISRGLAKLRERLDHEHHGGRAGWMSALVPFAHAPQATITGGLLLMSLTMKLALLGGVALLGVCLWIGTHTGGALEPAQPASPLAAEASALDPAAPQKLLAPSTASGREALAVAAAKPSAPLADEPAITGEVLDAREQPAVGARVLAFRQRAGDLSMLDSGLAAERSDVGRATTDAQGRFRLSVPQSATLQLEVDAGALGLAFVGERHVGEHVVIHLQPPGTLQGHVTRVRDGSSVAGVHLTARLSRPDRGEEDRPQIEFRREATSDATGLYLITGLPAGPYVVNSYLEGNGSGTWHNADVAWGASTKCDFALDELLHVHGTVREAVTHSAIANAEVSASWSFEHPVRTDSAGHYELSASAEFLHELYARASGYGQLELRYVRPGSAPPADGTLDIELQASRSCIGVVLARDGRPIEGAYVAACAAEYGELQRIDWRRSTTDAQGRFEIGDLRPDVPHALLARKPGFGTAVYEFPVTEMQETRIELGELRLASALAISGSVASDSGQPFGRIKLVLRGANADRGRWNETSRGWFLDSYVAEREGRTDEQGRFCFGDLAAGTYRLEAFRTGHNDPVAQELTLSADHPLDDVHLVVPTGLPLEGVVRDQAGKGVPHSYVSIEPEAAEGRGLDVPTDENGRFAAPDVPPGPYTLRVWPYAQIRDKPEERFLVPRSLEHVQAGRKDVEIVLEEGDWIRGRVLESDGSPASNVFVSAQDANGKDVGGNFFGTESPFRFGVPRGLALTVVARPSLPSESSPVGGDPDPDDAHAARVGGVVGGGDELVIKLPPR